MRLLRVILQLVRFPAVFTALADISLGYLLTHLALEPVSPFLLLLGASSCLYLSGMALNDVFDRKLDSRERPDRPIPSGRISVLAAALIGGGLMIAGVLLAAAAGRSSLTVAVLLAGAILLYDGLLKSTPLGPLAMGSCRFLNVMLGASATFFVWARPQIYIAGALGIYIAGVTWFARGEAGRSRRSALAAATAVVNAGLVALAAVAATWPGEVRLPGRSEPDPLVIFLLLGLLAVRINRRLTAALREPSPPLVQRGVKEAVLSLILLDAIMILFKTGRVEFALAVALLVLPARFLARRIYVT